MILPFQKRVFLLLPFLLIFSSCVFPQKSNSSSQGNDASGSGVIPNTVLPNLISVSPAQGLITGGTFLTLTGTGFTPGMQVLIGGVACNYPPEPSLFESSTRMGCFAGVHAAGVVDVEVISVNGISSTLSSSFLYSSSSGFPAPTVTSISPLSGPSIGDTSVSIIGTGFLAGASVNIVNGTCGSVDVLSPTQLTCITNGSQAGLEGVTVRNIDAQQGTLANAFTYTTTASGAPAPTLSSVSPATGGSNGGTMITLAGTGFIAGAVVRVGGAFCHSTNVVSATSITCTTPPAAPGSANIEVLNTDTQSATLGTEFTYTLAPVYSSLAKYVFGPNCTVCHGIGTYSNLMSTGWIVPGSPNNSPLYQQMSSQLMPPGGGIDGDLGAVQTWIQSGAANN